jgi:hypothetical protein
LNSLASLDVAWDSASARIASLASRHPRTWRLPFRWRWRFAVTAFGVAPQVPDPAALPQRTIVESVSTVDLHAQLEALADHELDLFRSEVTRAGDTADSLLAA